MKTKIIVSVLVLICVFGAWYISQGSTQGPRQSGNDSNQGIKLN